VKTADTDGYAAIQVTVGERRASRVTKAAAGHFAKANTAAGRGLWEMRNVDSEEVSVGDQLTVERFEAGQKVDVTGQSKGKGFQGGIKRWNFTMQDATHGNSISHRSIGSIGQCQTPGRVWKGKKMAGHMGSEQVTTQSLEIVRVDAENNLLLIKGAVPGAPGGDVIVRPTVKIRR
jgi:large subunit ribosomal protein L3